MADPDVESAHSDMIREIETRGLLYPVTVVNGVPTYDGAVSYPGIMRSVRSTLEQVASA